MLPAELQPGRLAALAEPPARRSRRPDPAVLAARPRRRRHLAARPARRRVHPRPRPGLPGALGERRGLLARHHRGRDRRPDLRGRDRRAKRGRRSGATLPRGGRRLAAQRRPLDADHHGAALPRFLLPTPHRRWTAGRADDVHDRRRRSHDRPARRRRHELPRAGAARGQARRRPGRDPHAAGHRPRARRADADRPVLAPVQLRRLRGDAGRWQLPGCRQHRSALADLRRRARRVRARRGRAVRRRRGRPRPAAARLAAIAATANSGRLLPEQVWDNNPPSGRPGYQPGRGTFSATPLGWTHAQFVRLAWSIDAGRPVEQPPSSPVATPASAADSARTCRWPAPFGGPGSRWRRRGSSRSRWTSGGAGRASQTPGQPLLSVTSRHRDNRPRPPPDAGASDAPSSAGVHEIVAEIVADDPRLS